MSLSLGIGPSVPSRFRINSRDGVGHGPRVGKQRELGDLPVNTALHPSGKWLAVLHAGFGTHEVLIVEPDPKRPHVVSRVTLRQTFNGLAFALIMGLIVFLWFGSNRLGAVIGAAMVINLVAAALAGIFIPLALDRAGFDPAVSSTVFVTTVTDVVGFLAFLGLASLWLL